MDNPRALQSWCYDSGEVVVSCSGVALAWGHVPHFCVHKGAPTEFTVRPLGRAVGLSDDLRRAHGHRSDNGGDEIVLR
nr:unnamed protein product [Digitaria exilis]